MLTSPGLRHWAPGERPRLSSGQAEGETSVQPTRSPTGAEVVARGLGMARPQAVRCSSVVLSTCPTSQVL